MHGSCIWHQPMLVGRHGYASYTRHLYGVSMVSCFVVLCRQSAIARVLCIALVSYNYSNQLWLMKFCVPIQKPYLLYKERLNEKFPFTLQAKQMQSNALIEKVLVKMG